MTNIPTIREQFEEQFGWAGSSGTFTGIRDEEIVKFIIAEREAGAREERERIVTLLNQEYQGQESQVADAIAFIKALTANK